MGLLAYLVFLVGGLWSAAAALRVSNTDIDSRILIEAFVMAMIGISVASLLGGYVADPYSGPIAAGLIGLLDWFSLHQRSGLSAASVLARAQQSSSDPESALNPA